MSYKYSTKQIKKKKYKYIPINTIIQQIYNDRQTMSVCTVVVRQYFAERYQAFLQIERPKVLHGQ